MKGSYIVITGGFGAIGSACAALFESQGDSVKRLSHNEHPVHWPSTWEHLDTHCDILVTCAAAPNFPCKSENVPLDKWQEILEVDVTGVFLASQWAFRHGAQRIIHLASFQALAAYPERVCYGTAKAAVCGMTRALAVEWAKYEITVNAVAPGPILTPRLRATFDTVPQSKKGMEEHTPRGILGTPKNVAETVRFLASNAARHITGQVIVVDGGWTASGYWESHE